MLAEIWFYHHNAEASVYLPADVAGFPTKIYEIPDEDWRYLRRFHTLAERRTDLEQTAYLFKATVLRDCAARVYDGKQALDMIVQRRMPC